MNRGVNQKKLFHFKDDFDAFLKLVGEYKERFNVGLFHYCLMTNHVHLLIKTNDLESLVRFSYYVQRRYAYYYCKTHQWHGQVFQRMYKSLPIEKESYLLECGRYIERNPIRSKRAKTAAEWPYTSYPFYAYGRDNPLLAKSPMYLEMASSDKKRREIYREYIDQDRAYDELVDKSLMLDG
ncbi:MAG: transposase [Candidatus Aminicenantes bacterium]|nr:transposase [Candidatus Aminicenantes bacterium]